MSILQDLREKALNVNDMYEKWSLEEVSRRFFPPSVLKARTQTRRSVMSFCDLETGRKGLIG